MVSNDVTPQVTAEANQAMHGTADQFLERLVARLGGQASAAAVYGPPVEREGVTVIPVAKVRWAFGGGAGQGRGQNPAQEGSGEGSGAGGGGAVVASPVGYVELANGQARFRRIGDSTAVLPLIPLMLASGISLFLILSGVSRVRRAGRTPWPRPPVPHFR